MAVRTGCNPFNSHERQNFPDWSPLFSRSFKTPPNVAEGTQKTFHWSIDQMAKLKPVDIATSPASLAVTNLGSPLDDPTAQQDSDKFFAQKTIFPSPWLISKPKKVTFSPHPPTTSYYTKEEPGKADASTQTILTIPMNVDLEKIIGKEFYSEDEVSFSLRRKLFGQPQRFNDSSCHDNQDDSLKSRDTQLSSTPLRSPHSPAVIITKLSEGEVGSPPQCSSFVDNAILDESFCVSPIKTRGSPGDPPYESGLELSPIVSQELMSLDRPEYSPAVTSDMKSISKRSLQLSPHGSPLLKQPCIHRLSPAQDSTHSDNIPSTLSMRDLTAPSTCTTYFNNLVLEDGEERQLQSLTSSSSWQPNIHSTMLEGGGGNKIAAAPPSFVVQSVDSGLSSDILTSQSGLALPTTKLIFDPSQDSGINQHIAGSATPPITSASSIGKGGSITPTSRTTSPTKYSLLPSRLKLTYTPTRNLAPPTSHYVVDDQPFSQDLLRKKNFFKAKLNFKSPIKQVPPLRTPLVDKQINSFV